MFLSLANYNICCRKAKWNDDHHGQHHQRLDYDHDDDGYDDDDEEEDDTDDNNENKDVWSRGYASAYDNKNVFRCCMSCPEMHWSCSNVNV